MSGSRFSKKRTRRVALGGVGLALAVSGMVAPTAAQAATSTARNGVCDTGEFCLSYNSGFTGSISDFAAGSDIPDYGTSEPTCYDFKGPGAGQGLCVKNNAAAARNLTSEPVTLYYNSNYGGYSQTIAPGQTVDLNSYLKNNNASQQFVQPTSSTSTCLNTFGNPRTCAGAVAFLKSLVGTNDPSYPSYYEHCDMWMAIAYGWKDGSGSYTAADHWSQMPAVDKHANERTVPVGGLAFFSGGSSGDGHVMMSIGGGQFISTDVNGRDTLGVTTISWIENNWHETYLGWGQPWFKINHAN